MKRAQSKYNENFLAAVCKKFLINSVLPVKLQKRELLEKLAFPVDNNRVIPIYNTEEIRAVFVEYLAQVPFLIGMHLKPMNSFITPFFFIEEDLIQYSDESGKRIISGQEKMFDIIQDFTSRNCWVEFVHSIWGPATIVGRLIYFSPKEQLLEIQKGVVPRELGNNREKHPYFSAELHYLSRSFQKQAVLYGSSSGISPTIIDSIIHVLRKHEYAFEVLRQVADLPTLEFGHTKLGKLIVIDIDWPSQYALY